VVLTSAQLAAIAASVPELPSAVRARLTDAWGEHALSPKLAEAVAAHPSTLAYYQQALAAARLHQHAAHSPEYPSDNPSEYPNGTTEHPSGNTEYLNGTPEHPSGNQESLNGIPTLAHPNGASRIPKETSGRGSMAGGEGGVTVRSSDVANWVVGELVGAAKRAGVAGAKVNPKPYTPNPKP
jgi:hypothetical protein